MAAPDYSKYTDRQLGQLAGFPNAEAQARANAEISKRKKVKQGAEAKAQRQEQLGEYDAESGQFFDQMRQGFRQRTQSLASAQQTGGMGALNQAAARRGISFSGVEQAAQANLQGQIGGAQVQAESEYDQRLNELRQTQRNDFLEGRFEFFDQVQLLNQKYDLDKEFATFQADLADQYSSGWGDFFGAVGQGLGMYASGGLSGLFGGIGGGGQNFNSPYGPTQYPSNTRE